MLAREAELKMETATGGFAKGFLKSLTPTKSLVMMGLVRDFSPIITRLFVGMFLPGTPTRTGRFWIALDGWLFRAKRRLAWLGVRWQPWEPLRVLVGARATSERLARMPFTDKIMTVMGSAGLLAAAMMFGGGKRQRRTG